jgi:flagellar basal body rod protein FlgC
MDFNNSIKISASALSANRLYMNVLSANLAKVALLINCNINPHQRS